MPTLETINLKVGDSYDARYTHMAVMNSQFLVAVAAAGVGTVAGLAFIRYVHPFGPNWKCPRCGKHCTCDTHTWDTACPHCACPLAKCSKCGCPCGPHNSVCPNCHSGIKRCGRCGGCCCHQDNVCPNCHNPLTQMGFALVNQ